MKSLVPLVVIAVSGCSGPATETMDAAMQARVDLRTPRDMTPEPTGAVKGIILDEAGKPAAGALVYCCSVVECPPGVPSGADGAFEIGKLALRQRMVKVGEDDTVMPRMGETIAPVLLDADGVTVDVGSLYLIKMGAGADVAMGQMPQVLDVGDGLRLTVMRNDITLGIGSNRYNLAARQVPLDHLPRTGFDIPGERVVAVWALLPFGTNSKTPIAVTGTVTGAAMLAPGTVVQFRSADQDDGHMSSPIPGKASMDGQSVSVSTDPGKGISSLTWLVVSTAKK